MAKSLNLTNVIGMVKRIGDGKYEPATDESAKRLADLYAETGVINTNMVIPAANLVDLKRIARNHGYKVMTTLRTLRPASHKQIAPVQLTTDDWVEISEALRTKENLIVRGHYGKEDVTGGNEKWIQHLKSICDAIGIDGELAARNGVAPVNRRG